MGLAFDDVLRHLLLEWLENILSNKVSIRDFYQDKEIDSELEPPPSSNDDGNLLQMEDDVLMVLSNRKRRLLGSNNIQQRKKKAKYKSNKIYFTHPISGEHEVMTHHYTVWWNNYIANPQDC